MGKPKKPWTGHHMPKVYVSKKTFNAVVTNMSQSRDYNGKFIQSICYALGRESNGNYIVLEFLYPKQLSRIDSVREIGKQTKNNFPIFTIIQEHQTSFNLFQH